MDNQSCNVLVLGGTGFIGRHIVSYLVKNKLATYVRAVDKVFPSTAYLSKEQQDIFESETVEFKQGNLISEASIKKIFTPREGQTGWDYVINCAAETRYGQGEEVYKAKILDLTVKNATVAATYSPKRFIHFSTARIYAAGKKQSKESDSKKPWTQIAKFHWQAEQELVKIPKLNTVILRPAVVYGPSDVAGIMPRIIVAACYRWTNTRMEFLWSKDLRIHTVHVRDVCKAVWFLKDKGDLGEVYNIVDESDSTQGSINGNLEKIFEIETGFVSKTISRLASLSMKKATDYVNGQHLPPFSELKKALKCESTPLTPYLDQELLGNNSLCVDGSKARKAGLKYDHPKMTIDLVQEQINHFVSLSLLPEVSKIPKGGSKTGITMDGETGEESSSDDEDESSTTATAEKT